ncbi:MAG TPA: transporter, partial [bacterium]|nr:transporter [bacterium]
MNDYSAFLVLIVIVSAGLLLGRIKIKGISLDLSAVLFVALLFGHWGLQVSAIFQTMGLCLFIYAVGVQAGPGFFDSFGKQTLKHILLAVLLVVVAALTAWVCFLIYDIDMSMAVGLLTGALTSTPGLAAAIEASQNPALASIGYGIAYPFGVIGVILFVYLVPIFFRVNVKKEEQDYQQEVIEQHPQIMHRHFMVNNKNIFGKTIAELNIRTLTGAT